MNNRTTILVLSAVLIAAVLSGCVEEVSDHGIETVGPTPQPNVTPSATPTISKAMVTPSPLQIPMPEATPALPLRKKIHQEIDTTPALAGLLEPYVSDITMEDIGFEVSLPSGRDREYDVYPLMEVGKPTVPYIAKKFKIPKDSDVESVSVNLSNPVEIRNIFIKPVQPPTIDSDGGYYWQNYTPPPYTIDNETYASSEPYPGREYEYLLSGDPLHGVEVVVYIFPIQYIPAESRIIAYRNASVSIFYRVPVPTQEAE
ncbi:MAG: hypothetical protein DRI32_04150 [Chloroflexi bacterium]|nr:MAG: hypothetical protein DRI32_04150 [Chloroflexota bacterium]